MTKKKIGRPKKEEKEKAKPNDIIDCKICGKKYIRASKISHEKTKYHSRYAKYHERVQRLVIKYLKPLED